MQELKLRYQKYVKLTDKALKIIKIKKGLDKQQLKVAKDILDLAGMYFNDARYFNGKGQIINAFAAVNYSHAFLDAGVRMKLFDVKDNKLFMVD